jgi:hypothetical protein
MGMSMNRDHSDLEDGCVRALEDERAACILPNDAVVGLRQALQGHFVADEELDRALGVTPNHSP